MQTLKTSTLFLVISILLLASCKRGNQSIPIKATVSNQTTKVPILQYLDFDPTAQIGEYVIEVFEDSKGNLWFGTLSKGVACFDGTSLIYLTKKHGLIGNGVTSIAEDKNGILWFGTQSGLSKYDGKTFTNYTIEEDLIHNSISNILIDSRDNMWIGTWGGVSRFDGEQFTNFPLPIPDVEVPYYQETSHWVTEIMEDSAGNIWFGRSGYGADKFDGKSFTSYTTEDGLYSNCVHAIVADKKGDTWFGSRVAERDNPDENGREGKGGLNRFDGKTFTEHPELKGLYNSDVYCIFKDRSDNIWISTTANGAYKYDGKQFTNFKLTKDSASPDSVPFKGFQCMLEDSKGQLWFGCSGGLFRMDGEEFVNVLQGGPWK